MSYNHFTAAVMRALHLTRLPVEGMEPRTVLGVRVWIEPLVMPNPTRWKRSTHRLLCVCPLCAWNGSVGRINQHACTHAERNCWGCGEPLERTTDRPHRYGGHFYCEPYCVGRVDESEPVDYDQQDRNAAASERIELMRWER